MPEGAEEKDVKVGGEIKDLTAVIASLKQQNGSSDGALIHLLNENKKLRAKNAKLRENPAGDGGIILTKDEAKAWSAYQDLGTPEELRKISRENGILSTENVKLKRDKEVGDVESLLGYKPGTLAPLSTGLSFEIKDEKRKDSAGKEVEGKYVYAKGEGDEKPIAIEEHPRIKPYLASLQPEKEAKARPDDGTPRRNLPTAPKDPDAEHRRLMREAAMAGSGAF